MRLRPLRDVLVVTDLSARAAAAIDRALSLPIEREGNLHLLCALSAGDPPTAPLSFARSVADLASAAGRPDLRLVSYRAEGTLWQEIGLHARTAVVDLVVIGGDGRTLRGSTGASLPRLVAVAGAPVLVVAKPSGAPYAKPLVAVDLELGSIDLLHLAVRVAGPASKGLVVLHAFDLSTEGMSGARGGINSLGERFFSEARRRVDELLSAFPAAEGSWEAVVVPGPAGPAIVDVAEGRDADLVVVGTHAVEGLPLLMTGSVSRYVSARLQRDLLVACPLSERVAFPPPSAGSGASV